MNKLILYCIATVLVFVASGLAYLGKEGWGWFLFAAVMCLPADTCSCEKEDQSNG